MLAALSLGDAFEQATSVGGGSQHGSGSLQRVVVGAGDKHGVGDQETAFLTSATTFSSTAGVHAISA